MPEDTIEKIFFFIFFPIHLILHLLPSYMDNAVPKKLVLCFCLNLILLCGCYFLIDWWAYELAVATGIPLQLIGLIFLGCLSSI